MKIIQRLKHKEENQFSNCVYSLCNLEVSHTLPDAIAWHMELTPTFKFNFAKSPHFAGKSRKVCFLEKQIRKRKKEFC